MKREEEEEKKRKEKYESKWIKFSIYSSHQRRLPSNQFFFALSLRLEELKIKSMNSSHPINPLSSINYKCGCLRLMNLVQVVVIVVLLITFLHIFWISFSNYLCFFLFKRLVALRNNISFNWSDDWTCIYTLFI
jgi:hypothetical protein